MIPEEHALRQLFHQTVSDCYSEHLGLRDTEVTSYIADLLTEFCVVENLYLIRDEEGNPVKEVGKMLAASDPIHGSASSFDAERKVRKHIGDYALFSTGMYPEAVQRSKFAGDATFFGRLAEEFESYMYGLTKVRGELDRMGAPLHPM
jgi:hypothetical protein